MIICANLWTKKDSDRRQVFIDHRLTQIGTDLEPKALKIERLMIKAKIK